MEGFVVDMVIADYQQLVKEIPINGTAGVLGMGADDLEIGHLLFCSCF